MCLRFISLTIVTQYALYGLIEIKLVVTERKKFVKKMIFICEV